VGVGSLCATGRKASKVEDGGSRIKWKVARCCICCIRQLHMLAVAVGGGRGEGAGANRFVKREHADPPVLVPSSSVRFLDEFVR